MGSVSFGRQQPMYIVMCNDNPHVLEDFKVLKIQLNLTRVTTTSHSHLRELAPGARDWLQCTVAWSYLGFCRISLQSDSMI